MQGLIEAFERRTTSDLVFDQLNEEILSLKLLPGTKLSEAEIAKRFGVSRQPVRDAFNRLQSQDLLLIRPQKATEVRGFSMKIISHARFVRLAVELEVIRNACDVWDGTKAAKLQANLDQQSRAIDAQENELFHSLDYDFHRLICELGGHPLAYKTIQAYKQKIDRICVLSLEDERETFLLFDDHKKIATSLANKNHEDASAIAREHLGRLDETLREIHRRHIDYFEEPPS